MSWKSVQQVLICAAIHFNNWRIIPRLILLAYWHIVWQSAEWFMKLHDPTTQQVTFISLILTSLGVVIGFYLKTGGIQRVDDETTQQNPQMDK